MTFNKIRQNSKHTLIAGCISYITQAIVNNFAPMLFLTFQSSYNISISMVTVLIIINFGTQMVVDIIAAKYVDSIGYRVPIVVSHMLCAVGLISLGILPEILPSPYVGLVVSIVICAVGSGLIEVVASPIVEASSTHKKAKLMSILHSFYCWGQALVVLISTFLFTSFGISNWRFVSIFWAIIPLINAIYFTQVPINSLVEDGKSVKFRNLFQMKIFWVFIVLMICAGAAELAMSQWSSALAESGLKISKTVSDIAGPATFAILMGISRVLYPTLHKKMQLETIMIFSGILCVAAYLITSLSPIPILSLIGCAFCGFSVGVFWPCTLSIASKKIPSGGAAIFGLLALAGDIGCITGPALIGFMSGRYNGDLKHGIIYGVLFPVVLIFGVFIFKSGFKKKQ